MKILALGDIHFPFEDIFAVRQAISIANEFRPDLIVQVGDLYDKYAASKYPRSLSVLTPDREDELGREHADKMWEQLRKAAPRAKLVQLAGNHDIRPVKRAAERNPESVRAVYKQYKTDLTFSNVETIYDPTEEFLYKGIVFMHGHRNRLGDHATYNQRSTVVGHSHRAGIVYFQNYERLFWEFNVGWLGNREEPVFSYRSQKILSQTTLGVGLIDERGPRFVSLED